MATPSLTQIRNSGLANFCVRPGPGTLILMAVMFAIHGPRTVRALRRFVCPVPLGVLTGNPRLGTYDHAGQVRGRHGVLAGYCFWKWLQESHWSRHCSPD